MAERKWQMRRLGKGDYVCWSNDMTKLWRFHSYDDGQIGGLDTKFYARTFWRAIWLDASDAERFINLTREVANNFVPNAWEHPWVSAGEWLPTRKAAVDVMLAAERATSSP